MNKIFSLNRDQLKSILLDPKDEVDVKGRGTGKSNKVGWKVHRCFKHMPRGTSLMVAQTYAQILTRTWPATRSFLTERLGLIRDIHFKVGERPPKHWPQPFEGPESYENSIVFNTGHVMMLASQDRKGSSRGPSISFAIADEALLMNKEQFDDEIVPTNRGNDTIFGHLRWNHGYHFASSMPISPESKWLLNEAKYYMEERKVDIISIWKQIVNIQIEMIEETNPQKFAEMWNYAASLKQKISPFVSKNGMLFSLGNAFDNIENVGLRYFKDSLAKMTYSRWLIEIMNQISDKVEDCFYMLTDNHLYTAYDYTGLTIASEVTDLNSCVFDSDCDKDAPLYIQPDWGARISVLTISQDKPKMVAFINELYTLPEPGKIMVDDLANKFCDYYKHMRNKDVMIGRDKYGDIRQANSSKSYNEMFADALTMRGFTVDWVQHRGGEPPMHEKYLLINKMLSGRYEWLPKIAINKDRCSNLILSMGNARVTEKDNKFGKDKSSEKDKSGVPPEQATHLSDSFDKILWIRFGDLLSKDSTGFIDMKM